MVTCGFLIGMLKATQSPLFRHQQEQPAKKKAKKSTKTVKTAKGASA